MSIVAFAGLRPLARRLDRNVSDADGVGSRRLIGRQGTVLEAIEPGHLGLVRVEREEWRAEAPDRRLRAGRRGDPGDRASKAPA